MKKILWKLAAMDIYTASVRYRGLIPVFEGRKAGDHENEIIYGRWGARANARPDAVVFVKSYSADDVAALKTFKQAGIFTVFDVCDNILASPRDEALKNAFREMVRLAEVVSVPTVAMAASLRESFGELPSITVIPDPIENLEHIQFCKTLARREGIKTFLSDLRTGSEGLGIPRFFYGLYLYLCFMVFGTSAIEKILYVPKDQIRLPMWRKLILFPYMIPVLLLKALTGGRLGLPIAYAYNLLKLKFVAFANFKNAMSSVSLPNTLNEFKDRPKGKPALRLLWFGTAGIWGKAGMSDLLLVKDELQKLNRKRDIELVVVSNSYPAFKILKNSMGVPCSYVRWNLTVVYEIIAKMTATLIPNPLSVVTSGKSANRTLLSLSSGVPVVATRTADLEYYSDCILFENWSESILRYADDENLKREHIERAQQKMRQSPNDPTLVWQKWKNLLENKQIALEPVYSEVRSEV